MSKKMSTSKSIKTTCSVLGYTYPKLYTASEWYVAFWALDPATSEPKRKRFMLDHIANKRKRKDYAEELIFSLVTKLKTGWNPWMEQIDSRAYTLFSDCVSKYKEYCERMDRKKTRLGYLSRLSILLQFNATQEKPIKYAYQYNEGFVSDFLDWIYLERGTEARTRNNYKGWCSSFASFLVERKLISSNPVENIKNLKEGTKHRKDLSSDMLLKLKNHCMIHEKPFYLACCMMYYTFIRPTELSHLRLRDISIKEQSVFISHEFSKNKKDGKVGLNEQILRLMLELEIFRYPSDYYLFGEGFLPSNIRRGPDHFNKKFTKVRKVLGWGDDYVFYSLKDSGIRDLANSEGVVVARDQARHSDITTTNQYIQGNNANIHEQTKHFDGSL